MLLTVTLLLKLVDISSGSIHFIWHSILTFYYGSLSGIYSDILFGTFFGLYSGISLAFYPAVFLILYLKSIPTFLSGILSDILFLAFYLAPIRTFYSTMGCMIMVLPGVFKHPARRWSVVDAVDSQSSCRIPPAICLVYPKVDSLIYDTPNEKTMMLHASLWRWWSCWFR